MDKKLPVGIKVLIVFLFVIGVLNFLYILPLVSWLKKIEVTPRNLGIFIGLLTKTIILIAVNVGAAFGLLKFKKWGVKLALIALFIFGFLFAVGLAIGFAQEFGGTNVSFIVSLMISLLVMGVIIFQIKKYLTKDTIKTLFELTYPR